MLYRYLAATLLLLSTIGSPGTAQEPSPPPLTSEDCQPEGLGREARCGVLTVPEDPAAPAGRQVPLHYVLIPALEAPAAPDPVVFLSGGPGLPALDMAGFFGDSLRQLQQRRAILLHDQRGTGRSNPLHCSFDSPAAALRAVFTGEIPKDFLERCLADLDADPRHYRTVDAVRDLEQLRAALGFEKLNLVGISYGSRVALAYLRAYPERVRTVTLRGAVGPAEILPPELVRNNRQAFDRLLAECSVDEECASTYPEALEIWPEMLEYRDVFPLEVPFVDGAEETIVQVDGTLIAGLVARALYDRRTAAHIPELLQRTAEGDTGPLAQWLERASRPLAGSLALGTYLSVLCSEDIAFQNHEEAARLFGLLGGLPLRLAENCKSWPHQPVDPAFKDPVQSPVPALLLSGDADPATPPQLAEHIATGLENHLHLVTPHLGHHPTWTTCFAQTLGAFLEAGAVDGLDGSCAEQGAAPPFVRRPPYLAVAIAAVVALLLGTLLFLGIRRWRRR